MYEDPKYDWMCCIRMSYVLIISIITCHVTYHGGVVPKNAALIFLDFTWIPERSAMLLVRVWYGATGIMNLESGELLLPTLGDILEWIFCLVTEHWVLLHNPCRLECLVNWDQNRLVSIAWASLAHAQLLLLRNFKLDLNRTVPP